MTRQSKKRERGGRRTRKPRLRMCTTKTREGDGKN